jgi:exosortase A-associated hydrolase 1
LQLSRYLANQGIASLRFDYRGMGDSEGHKQSFDDICADLKVACDALVDQDGIKEIIIWGLCDAASAAMIYAHKDPRISGLILLNPWLRSEQAMGKSMLKHYYVKRLLSKEFWLKLLSGKVNVTGSLSDAKGFAKDSMAEKVIAQGTYQQRMEEGVEHFSGPLCVILSGIDLTAKEFAEQALGSGTWPAMQRKNTELHHIEQADHTFSNRQLKSSVEQISYSFIKQLCKD